MHSSGLVSKFPYFRCPPLQSTLFCCRMLCGCTVICSVLMHCARKPKALQAVLLGSSLFCQHGTVKGNLKKQSNYFSDIAPRPQKQRIPTFLFGEFVRGRQQHRPQTGQQKRDPCHPGHSGHLTSNTNFAVNVASIMCWVQGSGFAATFSLSTRVGKRTLGLHKIVYWYGFVFFWVTNFK